MTKIILTVGCVGKTYLDKTYSNVYDFDKHTLEYKYDKTGFNIYPMKSSKDFFDIMSDIIENLAFVSDRGI